MAVKVTAEMMVKELSLIRQPEGGFFLETHRSGAIPMSSQGLTDFNVPDVDLVLTGRTDIAGPIMHDVR